MQRRQFLAASGTGLAVSAAGCLGFTAPGEDTHPLAGTTQTVRIDDESEVSPHDLETVARESLEFWEANSEQYVDFTVDFEIVESEDPDIVISYRDSPAGCENVPEYSERVLGCAPLLRVGHTPPRPIPARVVAGQRPIGKIRITTKHEIGHVLGLDHDQDPANIMSNRPEDRIPEYARRIDIWETVQGVHDRSREGTSVLNHGIRQYSEGNDEAAAQALDDAAAEFGALVAEIDSASGLVDELEANVAVETVAFDRLRELLGRLRDRMVAAEELALALAASARAEGQERRDQLDIAIQRSEEFNSISLIQLRDVAVALGLVRGFEDDDPIIEIEEEPPEEP